MDEADRAQLEIERQLAASLERAASLARAALGHPASSTRCMECGGQIEAARLTHGFGTCAECAREAWDIEERIRRHATHQR